LNRSFISPNPTPQEQEDLLPLPALVQNLQEAYVDDYPPLLQIDLQILEQHVVIQLEVRREEVEIIEEELEDSDSLEEGLIEEESSPNTLLNNDKDIMSEGDLEQSFISSGDYF
jgi:hypothetical protein